MHGEGVPKDSNKMIELWQKAAANGNAWAQAELGTVYAKGDLVEQNYEKAVALWELAVKQHHTVAEYQLGVVLRDGMGVERNPKRAINLFETSAEYLPIAAFNVAMMIYHGNGVKKDLELSYAWLKYAATTTAFAKSQNFPQGSHYGAPQAEAHITELSKMIGDEGVSLGDRLFEKCVSVRYRNCLAICSPEQSQNCVSVD